MGRSDCPTDADLGAYLAGALPPDRAVTLATHLEVCATCPIAATALYTAEFATGEDATVVGDSPTLAAAEAQPSGRGTLVGGRYLLIRSIGEGGMGSVFLAQQLEPVRRRVAVKLIKEGMDTRQVLARFDAERQALALMDHPNIARVLDAGTSANGRPFFVMELVDGVSITRYCDEALLSTRRRLDLFVPVCQAIQHAHQKGVIHRDIKPSNVLVALVDGRPVPKVIDFGIAKATDRRLTEDTLLTQVGALVGTPEYMSPEQADPAGVDVDTRTDVYSLGVLLYELLTGTPPLERNALRRAGLAEILRRIREEEPPRPSTRLSDSGDLPAISVRRGTEPRRLTSAVRGELDWIAMKALEKDRARRYESASALGRDVERFLADEAVEAGPPSTRYKMGKFARRHKGAIRAASASLLLLVAATAVSTWQAVRATRAERSERSQRLRSESRFALAQQAIEAFHSGAVEDVMLKEPSLKELRARLLGTALDFYRRLQGERRSEGGVGAGDLAEGYERVAELMAEIGSKREALDGYERALAIRRDLAGRSPADPGPRRNLARLYARIGAVRYDLNPPDVAAGWQRRALAEHEAVAAATGAADDRLDAAADLIAIGKTLAEIDRVAETHEAFDRATRELRELVKLVPSDRRMRAALALALHADAYARQNNQARPREAIPLFREANGLRQALAAEVAQGLEELPIRLGWAQGLHWLGVALDQVGRDEESLVEYRRSLDAIGPIAARYPTILAIRRSIADTRLAIGIGLSQLGRRVEALAEYRLAIPIYESMVEENPSVPIYRQRLASCLNSMALDQDSLGDAKGAATNYEKSLALRERLAGEDPSTLLHRHMLAENYGHYAGFFRKAGDRGGARRYYGKAVELLRATPPGNVINRYNRACFLSQYADLTPLIPGRPTPAEADLCRRLADEAMEQLRDAVKSGWEDAAAIDSDSDLDILRGREDFRLLRMDVGFPRDPFAR